MSTTNNVALLLLHALPLDGSMWAEQMRLIPGVTYAPTLYSLGDSVEEWAVNVLKVVTTNRLIVVGCSVGGSCALEVAIAAPERVAALVLIGTKAGHRPEPGLRAFALDTLEQRGLEEAWKLFWAPLFSSSADKQMIDKARQIAVRQSPRDVARGVIAFHSRPDRIKHLAAFPCPIFFISGAEDNSPGPKVSAAQADAAQHGHLRIVPHCGHYVPLERPALLNATLRGVIAAQQ